MKNGIFNIIRGIAFCFVLSIICLFGRVETKANTSELTSNDVKKLAEKGFGHSLPDNLIQYELYADYWNKSEHCALFLVDDKSANSKTLCIYSWGNTFLANKDTYIQYCNNNGHTYLFDNLLLTSDGRIFYFRRNDYISRYDSGFHCCLYSVNGGVLTNSSFNSTSYNTNYAQKSFTILLNSDDFNSEYDSTLGYLKNCVVKRGTTSPKDWKSYSEFFTHNIDYFSWDSLTTTSREVKKVEYKLYFYNGNSVVHKENSFIESSRAGTYATSKTVFWNTFTDINWKDILIDKNAHYEIWFRPCEGNLYGDWCYFDISLPSWLTRFLNSYNENDGDILSCFLYWIENGLDILGDGAYDLGQCTYAEKEGTYEPSESPDTNHSFSKVVNSYVVNYIDNSDKSVDDVTNIIESLPPSTNSYTEIINNITVIQNGNEDGNSLINKFGDLLSFCKNFLTFIYNFINLILSPLSFLPSWLKSLLSMSIIAFIVICVIKTLRG